jgi:hypothetical protein
VNSQHVDWRPIFLAALSQVPVVQRAAEIAGINRSTAQRLRKFDQEFADAWDAALEDGVDAAEQEAFRRAVTGFQEPVIDRGRLVYQVRRSVAPDGTETFAAVLDDNGQPVPLTIRKHSDALLALILKGRRKKLYSERTELTGADGDPLVADDAARSARIAQILAAAKQRQDNQDNLDDLM